MALVLDIETSTTANSDYRRIIYTSSHMQLGLMSIRPGFDIGWEKHDGDQFIRVEGGIGVVQFGGVEFEKYHDVVAQYQVRDGDAFIIPAGTYHNVTTLGSYPLKIYTIYSPPEHAAGTLEHEKS